MVETFTLVKPSYNDLSPLSDSDSPGDFFLCLTPKSPPLPLTPPFQPTDLPPPTENTPEDTGARCHDLVSVGQPLPQSCRLLVCCVSVAGGPGLNPTPRSVNSLAAILLQTIC